MQIILRFVFRFIRLSICGAAGLILFAWLIGRVLSDRYGFSQWLLWIPTPVVIGCLIIGLFSIRMGEQNRFRFRMMLTMSAIFIGLLMYFVLIEHRFFHHINEDGIGLRLVHWNMSNLEDDTLQREIDAIKRLDGDVMILSGSRRSPWRPEIRQGLGKNAKVIGAGPFVILSRIPIVECRSIVASNDIRMTMLRLDVSKHQAFTQFDRPLVVYIVDLPSDPDRSRWSVANETRGLLDIALETDPSIELPDIVVGDFNMTRGGAAINRVFPDMRHAYNEAGSGYGATFHRKLRIYHIYHVLLGESVNANSYRLFDPGVSRHMAQIASIKTADIR